MPLRGDVRLYQNRHQRRGADDRSSLVDSHLSACPARPSLSAILSAIVSRASSARRRPNSSACAPVAVHYGVPPPPADRPVEALASLAEALVAVLDELPATAAVGRRRGERAKGSEL